MFTPGAMGIGCTQRFAGSLESVFDFIGQLPLALYLSRRFGSGLLFRRF
jgi:hypothetical protein